MRLRDYLQVLRRRRWTVLRVVAVTLVFAVLLLFRTTPIYRASVRLLVQPSASTSSEGRVLESLIDPERRIQTQIEVIQSAAVLRGAARALGLPSIDDLRQSLSVRVLRNSQILEVSVEHERPEEASAWANAVARAYLDFRQEQALSQVIESGKGVAKRLNEVNQAIAEMDKIMSDLPAAAAEDRRERDRLVAELPSLSREKQREAQDKVAQLDRQIADYESGGAAVKANRDGLIAQRGALIVQQNSLPDTQEVRASNEIIESAATPAEPVKPNKPVTMFVAFMIGLALGIGLALLAENLDDRIRDDRELVERVGAPILAHVPWVPEWAEAESPFVAVIDDPGASACEAFRTLRTNLRFLAVEHELRVVLVTSSVAAEGKSMVSSNLSAVFAQGGTRTILVSADLRRPTIYKLFGVSDRAGIIDALEPQTPLTEALQATEAENLLLLSGGGIPPNPTEIFASRRFANLLRRLRETSEMVVIDSPPTLGLSDVAAIASSGAVDGVILVTDTKQTTRKNIQHAVDQLGLVGARILGIVVNSVDSVRYGYYHDYYFDYTTGQESADGASRLRDEVELKA